ncbi:MAG: hypothetical protein JF564_06205, partial [Sphingomonas sp.]|nr:hypothetical protein [Sphingomonas sp.]
MHNLWRSAAYRIAFGYAAAFAFAILLLGTAIFFVADAEFRQQRDGVLSEEMEDLANEGLGRRLIHELEERGRLRTRQDFAYALFDRAGRRIGGSLDIPRPPIGYSLVQFRDLAGEWEEGRAKAMALSDGSRLVVALDSEAVDAIDRTILAVFAVTFIAILVIGVGAAQPGHRVVAADVDDKVELPLAAREAPIRVVDDVVGAERADQVSLGP